MTIKIDSIFIVSVVIFLGCFHRSIGVSEDENKAQPTYGSDELNWTEGIAVRKKDKFDPKIKYRYEVTPHVTSIAPVEPNLHLKRGFITVRDMNKPLQSITLNKDVYQQGEIAVLEVSSVRPLENAKIEFLRWYYPLYENERRDQMYYYQTIFAVPIDADTGKHTMEIVYFDRDDTEEKKERRLFTIIEGDFRTADTSEVDLPMLSEETMALLRFEHRYFAKGYRNGSKDKLWDGDFIWPAQGKITGEFGVSRKYNDGKDCWTHKAIDIASYVGAKIFACNNGTVTMVEDLEAHGISLMIDHGAGVHSIYIHMDTVYVQENERVKKGDIIGEMGDTGFCTGPNLHWQVMVNRIPTDPRQWLAPEERKLKKGEYVKPVRKKNNR